MLVGGAPLLAASIWGIFAVPDDPSRSGNAPIPISGRLRLAIEFVILGGGIMSFALAGRTITAAVLAALLVLHYALSRDRIDWLLRRWERRRAVASDY